MVGSSRRQRRIASGTKLPLGRYRYRLGSTARPHAYVFLSDLCGLRRGKREGSGARGRASAGGHAVQGKQPTRRLRAKCWLPIAGKRTGSQHARQQRLARPRSADPASQTVRVNVTDSRDGTVRMLHCTGRRRERRTVARNPPVPVFPTGVACSSVRQGLTMAGTVNFAVSIFLRMFRLCQDDVVLRRLNQGDTANGPNRPTPLGPSISTRHLDSPFRPATCASSSYGVHSAAWNWNGHA